jgi:hypothetical protein
VQPTEHPGTDGFVLFFGDDAGMILRYHVTKADLLLCGLTATAPQTKEDAFLERRLPRRRVRAAQVSWWPSSLFCSHALWFSDLYFTPGHLVCV